MSHEISTMAIEGQITKIEIYFYHNHYEETTKISEYYLKKANLNLTLFSTRIKMGYLRASEIWDESIERGKKNKAIIGSLFILNKRNTQNLSRFYHYRAQTQIH